MLAAVRDAAVRRPQPAHQLKTLLEDTLVVLERDVERQIFAPIVAAPGGKHDPAAGQKIERRPLLGDPDRVMQRQHGDCRSEPDARGIGGDIGQHEVRAGQHAQRVEMMLADPGRAHAELVGIESLGGDVGDKLVRRARIVLVVIIAQREIPEFHLLLLQCGLTEPAPSKAAPSVTTLVFSSAL
jgi:hypothetical protein